ncbi:MAG: gamma-glutamyltransferase [Chloroflexi bacterium]|nr:gamma-glutamyltransferase [Chloroflexota bacterium]
MPAPTFPNAAVASPHYLASSAGLSVLASGGNAADAAIAMNLVLAVVYPHMCGLGGDLIAMVWAEGKLHGLNSTGRLPAAAEVREKVPGRGIGSVTVPGGVAGLRALHERFASRDLTDLAQPAIDYARRGVPRAPGLKKITEMARPLLERDPETERIYLAPDPLVQTDLAETLDHFDDFYDRVGKCAPAPFTPDDFTEHKAEWVEPVRTRWRDLDVCEMPPNSRGHLALKALDCLEPLDELSPDDAEWHRRLIRALDPARGDGDTIYLCAMDRDGMAVSLNQSLYQAFGSGVTIPGTGVLLQNRGAYFEPHQYRPGAKPVHTLAPAMALKDGRPRFVFGTMGGEAQIQVHLQLLARVFVAGQELGEAIAAPRWRFGDGGGLLAEVGLPDLGAQPMAMPEQAGHAHGILVEPDHLVAAADPRSDGAALGY